MTPEVTYWNGEPTPARKVTLIVADSEASLFWGREFVGQRRNATEVTYCGDVFYLDDEALGDEGEDVGWRKVTLGRGSPHFRHRNLRPQPGSVEPRGSGVSALNGVVLALCKGEALPLDAVNEIERLLDVLRVEGWSGSIPADEAVKAMLHA